MSLQAETPLGRAASATVVARSRPSPELLLRLFLLLTVLAFSAAAQPNLFLLPGPSGVTNNVNPYTTNPFLPYPTFEAPAGANFFFVHPNGNKFYIVARSGSNTLRVLNSEIPFAVLKNQSLVQAEAAALTPNGQRLLILGSTLSIFETAADTLLATIPTPNAIDIAVSRDSSRAFVLSAGQVTAINLATNTVLPNPLSLSAVNSIATGLNGLIYVTAPNRIYEIDPVGFTVRRELAVNGRPGRLVFTPDGLHALAVNETPMTGVSLFRIALPGFTVSGTIPNFQVILTSLVVARNNRVYAHSASPRYLYDVTVEPLNITVPQFGNLGNLDRVLGIAASLETPVPRNLYVLTVDTFYRLDNTVSPPAATPGGEVMSPSDPGSLFFRAAAVTTGAAAAILPYNTAQSTPLGTVFLPVIARVTDSNGRPLSNTPVNFSSNLPAAPVNAATVFTDNEGFAQTTVQTPATQTSFQVTAQAGSAPVARYQLTTAAAAPTSGDTLTIVRGQGQIVQEQFQIRDPLTVVLRNAAGAPVVGQPVTFSLISGSGSFNTSTSDGTLLTGVTCTGSTCTGTTDAEGRTAIGFIATGVPTGNSYSQQTIAASASGRTVNFVLTTVLGQLSGGTASPPLVERLAPAGNLLTGAAGSTIADAIRVRVVVVSGPQSGQAIPNVSLRAFTANTPGSGPTAQCAGPDGVALTGGDGIATCNLVLGPTTGLAPLSVNIGGFTSLGGSSINLDVRGGPPVISGSFPLAGQGTASNFSFSVSHPDGLNRLGVINLLINSSLNGAQACYAAYSVPLRVLYLVNDAGPAAGLSAPITLGAGSSGVVANSQCQINGAFSSAVTSGNSITLSLNTQFRASFAGGKVLYVAARTTDELNTGWRTAGVYDIPVATPSFPNSSTANPSAGTATSTVLSFNYRAQGSHTNLETVWGLVNASLDGAGACYFAYHSPTSQLFLVPDNGNGALASSIPLPGSGTIENSQCRINAFGSVVNRSGDTLSLTLNITFKSGFSGPKVIWTAASTLTGVVSPWRAAGAWLLP